MSLHIDEDFVYHYGNKDKIMAFVRNKQMKPSYSDHSGQKVFFTNVSPRNSKEAIIKNNYSALTNLNADRADFYIKIPSKDVCTEAVPNKRVISVSCDEAQPVDLARIPGVLVGKHGEGEATIEAVNTLQVLLAH